MLLDFLMFGFKNGHELFRLELIGHQCLTLTRDLNFFDGADAAKRTLDSLAVEEKVS